MACKEAPYKQLYDQFVASSFFGGLERAFLEPIDADIRGKQILAQGFIINKDINEILPYSFPKNSFHYAVYDHLRVIEEVFSGIFKSENKEFNYILRPFLKEFIFNNVYIIYSEEFKEYELTLAAKVAEENQEDPYERLEKGCPNSNFRLLRRVTIEPGKYRWDSVLTGVQGLKVEEMLPVIGDKPQQPIRVSYNEGFMFRRIYDIFSQYEAQMQTYKLLFNALHKVGDINGEDVKAIRSKRDQMETPQVFSHTVTSQVDTTTTIENLELVDKMPMLTESYDNIHALLNDSLGRLGLAGDDSTKAERITTGENFRALQPNMAFQQAVQNSLDIVTERIREHFQQDVVFVNGIKPNEQGIPTFGEEPKEQKEPKPNE